MKKMMFLSKNWYFSVQKALIYCTVNKSHHNSFILLVFSHVANFRYVANFRFLTLHSLKVRQSDKNLCRVCIRRALRHCLLKILRISHKPRNRRGFPHWLFSYPVMNCMFFFSLLLGRIKEVLFVFYIFQS